MPTRLDYRESAEQLIDRRVLALLRLVLEQLNLLRQKAGLAPITEAQALARLKELVRR